MKSRILTAALTVVVGLVVFLYGPMSQVQARMTPETALESLFTDVNSGDLDAAVASFSEDAIARNQVRGETYTGSAEIKQMLAGMHKEGRRLAVVATQGDGEKAIVTAEISDDGLAWATEWFAVELKAGKIQSFELIGIRLRF